MNDEQARQELSASAYRVYRYWLKKGLTPKQAAAMGSAAYNNEQDYQERKKRVKEK